MHIGGSGLVQINASNRLVVYDCGLMEITLFRRSPFDTLRIILRVSATGDRLKGKGSISEFLKHNRELTI